MPSAHCVTRNLFPAFAKLIDHELRAHSGGSADSVAALTLNRPKVLNALNAVLFAELDAALDVLEFL